MEPHLSWLITNFLAAFLLPPLDLILLMAAGLLAMRRRPRLGKALVASGLVLLYALSTPLVAGTLIRLLEVPPLSAKTSLAGVGAIVVLGAGRYEDAPEYGGDTANALALERLRYGARLHRQTGLSILVTGGAPAGGVPEGRFMKDMLEKEFGVPVRWMEDASDNTRENAINSARILAKAHVTKILLVTHAWHMPRARFSFERAGLEVIPAGTHFTREALEPMSFMPDAGALRTSAYAMHEAIGLVWYRLRGLAEWR